MIQKFVSSGIGQFTAVKPNPFFLLRTPLARLQVRLKAEILQPFFSITITA